VAVGIKPDAEHDGPGRFLAFASRVRHAVR
jgi:hypothetical protein